MDLWHFGNRFEGVWYSFYRATLCVSAVLAVGRCPSVCLSHSCIVVKRLKISKNFFHFQVSLYPSSFFSAKAPLGEPLQWER